MQARTGWWSGSSSRRRSSFACRSNLTTIIHPKWLQFDWKKINDPDGRQFIRQDRLFEAARRYHLLGSHWKVRLVIISCFYISLVALYRQRRLKLGWLTRFWVESLAMNHYNKARAHLQRTWSKFKQSVSKLPIAHYCWLMNSGREPVKTMEWRCLSVCWITLLDGMLIPA